MTLAPLPVAIALLAAAGLAATDFIARRIVSDAVAVLSAAAVTTVCAILLVRTANARKPISRAG